MLELFALLLEILLELAFLLDELFALELFLLLLETLPELDFLLDELLMLELFLLLETLLEFDDFLLDDELLILEFFTGRLPPRWLLTVATDELFALLLEFDSWLDEFLILELFSLLEILFELEFLLDELFLLLEILLKLDF